MPSSSMNSKMHAIDEAERSAIPCDEAGEAAAMKRRGVAP